MTEAELRDITGIGASARLIRTVLAAGSTFFVVAALLLLVLPDAFAVWIGLESTDAVDWALRMIGAVLLGLSGLMWLVRRAGDHPVLGAGAVMMLTSGLLTFLTLTLPGEWTPLRWALLGAGAVFVLAYAGLLVASRRS